MTPFGAHIRALRRARGITQKDMAESLGVSAAYLSALEHGRRGVPTWPMVQKIVGYFNVIWDEAEEMQRLAAHSRPKVTIDTAGLSPDATRLANRLAGAIAYLDANEIAAISGVAEAAVGRAEAPRGNDGD